MNMETLCKLYLELANIVPADCISSREKAKQRQIDRYGVRLMMIAEGCADPQKVAKEAIAEFAAK